MMMERHLKKGTIFISMEDEKVYQVSGIISSWEEMFWGVPVPVLLRTTFIPFRDVIISDGLVAAHHIAFGGHIKNAQRQIYGSKKEWYHTMFSVKKYQTDNYESFMAIGMALLFDGCI